MMEVLIELQGILLGKKFERSNMVNWNNQGTCQKHLKFFGWKPQNLNPRQISEKEV